MIAYSKFKTFTAWIDREEHEDDEIVTVYKDRPNRQGVYEPVNIIETHIHDGKYPEQVLHVLATILEKAGSADWRIVFLRNHWSWKVSIGVEIGGRLFVRDSRDLDMLPSEEIKVQLIALISTLGGIINQSGYSLDLWGQVVNYPTAKRIKCPMEVFHVFR